MQPINPRDLFGKSPAEIVEFLPSGNLPIHLDDGDFVSTRELLAFSRVFHKYHKRYNIPLTSEHVVTIEDRIDDKITSTLLDNIYGTLRTYGYFEDLDMRDKHDVLAYKIMRELNTSIYDLAEDHLSTLDEWAIREIVTHPKVADINRRVKAKELDTVDAKDQILDVIKNDPLLADNPVTFLVKVKAVKINQLLKLIGPIGRHTDLNSRLFSEPILTSYHDGLKTLYDVIVDANVAAMAYIYQNVDLGDTEYAGRRTQLAALTVAKVVKGDCGSKDYISVKVTKEGKHDKLKTLIGSYYINPISGELDSIKGDETHLYGKVIQKRAAHKCQHEDADTICSTCFGDMYFNTFNGGNIGHQCLAHIYQIISQSVLGVKHNTEGKIDKRIQVAERMYDLFETRDDAFLFYLKRDNDLSDETYISISPDEIRGLSDITLTDDVRGLDWATASYISSFTLSDPANDYIVTSPLINKKHVHLSESALAYINKHGYTIGHGNRIDICLDKWDVEKPLFRLKAVAYKMSAFAKDFGELYESSRKHYNSRLKKGYADVVLHELYELINSKLSVNISLLEVAVYVMMCDGLTSGLARGSDNPTIGVHGKIMSERSLAPNLAYEKHGEIYSTAGNFQLGNRPDSPFDVLVSPEEWFKYNT